MIRTILPHHSSATTRGALISAAWLVLSCGGTDDVRVEGRPASPAPGNDTEVATGTDGAGAGPIAVLTRVCGPENCLHYLNAFGALPADGVIDRSQGVESGNTQGKVFGDGIYIFDRDDNSVTRWTVGPNLELQRGATVSFQAAGVVDACAICNVFGNETHAYMVDSTSGVIATWNPAAMVITSVQDMPEEILERDGLPAGFAWPLVVNGRAFLAASWTDYETLQSYGSAAVATFDATVDEPSLTILEDIRCGVSSAVTPFLDASGNVNVVGDWSSGLLQIGTATPAPNPACLLRLGPAGDTFDPGYYVDLLQAADARAVYGAYGMKEGKLLLNYWPTSEAPPSLDAIAEDPFAYYSGLGFRYGVLDPSTLALTEVSGIAPAGAGNNTPLVLDDVNLIQVYPEGNTSDDVGADLYAISLDGLATRVLSAGPSGDFEMIGRVRP